MAALIAGNPLPAKAQVQPMPSVDVGSIERLTGLESRFVDARPIDVWLPPGYSADRRYAVLYMHDGQGLFDARVTWNHAAWNVHLALNRLMQAGAVQDTIVVGIPNNGIYRYSEYFPEKFLPLLPDAVHQDYVKHAQRGRPLADAYLRFIVEELKPAVDRRFATRTEAAGTFIMGSSMGGLISLYAISELPGVFGAAACLSTHWPAGDGATLAYLATHVPRSSTHRLYFDHGTATLDSLYGPYQEQADAILRRAGYRDGRNFSTRLFDGAEHSERAWRVRVEHPLMFLLKR